MVQVRKDKFQLVYLADSGQATYENNVRALLIL